APPLDPALYRERERVSSSTIIFAELAGTLMEVGGNGGRRLISDLSSGTIDEAA
ncbi:hypothetical protein KI387_009643, partial [Taxus chinensis]